MDTLVALARAKIVMWATEGGAEVNYVESFKPENWLNGFEAVRQKHKIDTPEQLDAALCLLAKLTVFADSISAAADELRNTEEEKVTNKLENPDAVHPKHYNTGKIECFDALEIVLEGWGGFRAFYIGNAFKYLWRAGRKGPWRQDIEKAVVYLNKMLEDSNEPGRAVDDELFSALDKIYDRLLVVASDVSEDDSSYNDFVKAVQDLNDLRIQTGMGEAFEKYASTDS